MLAGRQLRGVDGYGHEAVLPSQFVAQRYTGYAAGYTQPGDTGRCLVAEHATAAVSHIKLDAGRWVARRERNALAVRGEDEGRAADDLLSGQVDRRRVAVERVRRRDVHGGAVQVV